MKMKVELAPEYLQSTPLRQSSLYTRDYQKLMCIRLPENLQLVLKYVLPPIFYFFSELGAIISDIAVAIGLYIENHSNYWPFALTLTFIFLPSLLLGVYAVYNVLTNSKLGFWQKICRTTFYSLAVFTLNLWPLWSYLKLMCYGIKAVKNKAKREVYIEMIEEINESADFKTQQLISAFLESAPQLLLQLYLLMIQPTEIKISITVAIQIISILMSLIDLTNTVVQFHSHGERNRAQQLEGYSKVQPKGNTCSCLSEYFWWFCSIAARVIALSLFASVFSYWALIICLAHSAIMAIFIMITQPKLDSSRVMAAILVSLIYIFCFLEYKGNFSQISRIGSLYIMYYTFTLPQNAFMVLFSYFYTADPYGYQFSLLIAHFVLSSLALIFMFSYLGLAKSFTQKKNILTISKYQNYF